MSLLTKPFQQTSRQHIEKCHSKDFGNPRELILTACPISDNKHARPPITFMSPLVRAGKRSTSFRYCTLHNKIWGTP